MNKSKIFVNQAGYYTNAEKYAVLAYEADSFNIIDQKGNKCYSGKITSFGHDENSGDEVFVADFSDFCAEGTYSVEINGEKSNAFLIGKDCMKDAFEKLEKAFYYLRCGCALEEKYAGKFTHAKCHSELAQLWDDHSVELEVSGGWHDAGDYGRYITAAACAVTHLLYAYRLFPKAFDNQNLNIPESEMAVPDILSEVRYELEWMLKMQREDGAVYHKATTAHHAAFIMPEEDKNQMYVLPISTMATADFAAVCALASGIYRKYDEAFSDRLMATAEKTYKWLQENPEFIGFKNPEGNGTGGYYESDDKDNRFWASCEMFAATGDEKYHQDIVKALENEFPLSQLGYGSVGGFGAMAYLFCDREGKSEELTEKFTQTFIGHADKLVEFSESCGYKVAMHTFEYCWGSNMNTMKNGMIFAIADFLAKKAGKSSNYMKYANRQMNYLFGTNALGISYVSGVGEYCINNPHLRTSYADGIEECIPGMVSGGPNRNPCAHDQEIVHIPEGTPPMKCFADDWQCFSLNEITIYWNSPAVFTMAALESGK